MYVDASFINTYILSKSMNISQVPNVSTTFK